MAYRTGKDRENAKLFAKLFGESLDAKGVSQTDLAQRVGTAPSYANQWATGKRVPSPEWINLIADTLGLQKAERTRLHYAAAKDAGYELPELDLTRK